MQPNMNPAIGINTPRKDRKELKITWENHLYVKPSKNKKTALQLSRVLHIVLKVVELNATSLKQICHLVKKK